VTVYGRPSCTAGEAIRALAALAAICPVAGAEFEFKLLRKLGALYLDENQPRKGLVALRSAAANFPNRPEAKEIGDQMSSAFRELYLDGGADRLSPLTAVALYDEFRELTPAGAEGDRMMSLLADRLVKVDLLGRAGEFLDTLVAKRLSGPRQGACRRAPRRHPHAGPEARAGAEGAEGQCGR
jgi:hypothetical protein